MHRYIAQRLLQGLLSAFLVSLLIFVILRIAPGDVAMMVYTQGDEGIADIDEEALDRIRENLGLHRPLHLQYMVWVWDMVTFDWGTSYFHGGNVWEDVKQKLPVTVELGILSMILSVAIAFPLGILMALKQDTWSDYVGRVFSLGGLSIPNFWIATMVLVVGLYVFNWSPRLEYKSFFDDPFGNLSLMFWPAVIVGYSSTAIKARMLRSSMLEVLRQDYIRTAHAKGLSGAAVTYRHALRNAMLPVVTIVGFSVAAIIGGSVIMETIFQMPGLGQYLVAGMNSRDYNIVQSLVTFFAMWIILINILVDISYAWLDPRIRFD